MERERSTQLDRIDLGVASVLQRASLALYTIFALITIGVAADLLLDPPEAFRSGLLVAFAVVLITYFTVLRSSRRMVARERRASRERTQSFFDLSLDMLCTIDRNDRLAELNPSWTRVLGFDADELRGRPAIEFVHPDDRERTIEISAAAMAAGDEGTVLENRWQTREGNWRWLSWSLRTGHDDVQLYGRATDITDRKIVEDELAFLARHDELTGLANRRKFEEDLADHLNHTRRYGWRGALLAIDLDGLKAVNDAQGHASGDALLRLAAERMDTVLRGSDKLARLGGDEFAVLLPEADPPQCPRGRPEAGRRALGGERRRRCPGGQHRRRADRGPDRLRGALRPRRPRALCRQARQRRHLQTRSGTSRGARPLQIR